MPAGPLLESFVVDHGPQRVRWRSFPLSSEAYGVEVENQYGDFSFFRYAAMPVGGSGV